MFLATKLGQVIDGDIEVIT